MISKITNTSIPKTLYKYRDWTNRNHRKLITKQEIYLPRPSEFNDPFDGNIPVRWDLMTYEECLEKNFDLLKISLKNKDPKLVREYAKTVTDNKTMWHPEKLAKERPEQLDKWNSIIGLLSLSSVPNNILMWSHYSFNHTGFVIGFDSDSLMTDYGFDYLEPIIYQSEYPVISGLSDSTKQFYNKFFHKSNLWSYEEEWRVSKNHIKNRVIKINSETINKVIIGYNADLKTTNRIIKLSRNHLGNQIQIEKASKNENDFGLTIKRLE